MVNLGIVGLGPDWETRYRPVLEQLQARISVRAVCDAVAARAEQTAVSLGVRSAAGIRSLAERSDVDAVLFLDGGWLGVHGLTLLSRCGKPVFIGGCIGKGSCITENRPLMRRLYAQAVADGLSFVPELWWRHTPATSRLQELMATRLGAPRRIRVEWPAPLGGPHGLAPIIDWCNYVLRATPVSLELQLGAGEDSGCLRLLYPAKGGRSTAEAELALGTEAPDGALDGIRARIECAEGSAAIDGTRDIVWENEQAQRAESLTTERSALEVMLDHFCRRVVGGLIPIADLADLDRCLALAELAWESRRTRRSLDVRLD